MPGSGRDVANIGALSLPGVVDTCLHRDLEKCADFDAFLGKVRREIQTQCNAICDSIRDLWFVPSPFMALLLDEEKYCNFGIHGTGIATAADSLAAIQKCVFDEKRFSARDLTAAVDADFEGFTSMLHTLRWQQYGG